MNHPRRVRTGGAVAAAALLLLAGGMAFCGEGAQAAPSAARPPRTLADYRRYVIDLDREFGFGEGSEPIAAAKGLGLRIVMGLLDADGLDVGLVGTAKRYDPWTAPWPGNRGLGGRGSWGRPVLGRSGRAIADVEAYGGWQVSLHKPSNTVSLREACSHLFPDRGPAWGP
jgi:hypothetical protein